MSDVVTWLEGMRAIFATTCSTSVRADALLAAARRHELLCSTRLVDHVDGLVRLEAVGDVAVGQLGSRTQRLVGVAQMIVILEARLEPFENLVGVVHVRLGDVDLLEAPRQRPVLVEDAAILL